MKEKSKKTSAPKRRIPRSAFLGLVLGLSAGYLLWGGNSHAESGEAPTMADHGSGMPMGLRTLAVSPAQRELMRIRTVPVERRFPEVRLRMVGKVNYDETRLGYITAWVPGRIDALYVDSTGIQVSAGNHMVKLYSPDLYTAQEALLQSLVALEQMEASDLESMRETTQGMVDAAREKLLLWGLSEEQVAEVEERGTAEEYVTIYSPVSGLVIHRGAQEGMYVQTGTRIFTIADLSQVWIELDAYESDLQWLRYGQEVTITTETHGGLEFAGRISFIDPILDQSTRTVKVRVIVPNSEGLLKPGMFVHASAFARIADGGKVIDAALAGKWLSPMHPEVVRDEPGVCDVCGMDLVSAEDLGYLPADRSANEAPLVIPVSATLMTGTRAIVYVEVPGAHEPTYEGREVVLGPRAGDEYIVLHGLQEGELVVAMGNFKIDSALQLQAKPSMMSPDGGQAAGGHDHGGGGPGEMQMSPEEMEAMTLSDSAMARLQSIERSYAAISAAHASGSLEEARTAFADLGELVASTDQELFAGRAHPMWMELSMRLSNDSFEGRNALDAETMAAALGSLDRTVAMMRKHFSSTPYRNGDQDE